LPPEAAKPGLAERLRGMALDRRVHCRPSPTLPCLPKPLKLS
jgi:hypothetical protein